MVDEYKDDEKKVGEEKGEEEKKFTERNRKMLNLPYNTVGIYMYKVHCKTRMLIAQCHIQELHLFFIYDMRLLYDSHL